MPATAEPRLVVCPDADSLAERAADAILDAGRQAIAERGRFLLVLTGGSTPEKMYTVLAQPGRVNRLDWSQTYVFVGDERFVSYDDPRSNYGMARRTLLAYAPIPADHLFPMPTDRPSPAEAAADYGRTLASFFGLTPGQALPRFDLLLLGMGDDGHTASLFPGKPTLHEKDVWVTWSPPGTLPPPVDRVTLTFPVLNAAAAVLFLVAGDKKARPLREVLQGPPDVDRLPSTGVHPVQGTLTWMVDQAAARLLSRRG